MASFNDVLAALDRRSAGLTFAGASPAVVPYEALGALVRGNAAGFLAQGVRRGDRVAIILEADLEHVCALLALIAIGAVPMSLKPPRRGDAHDARGLALLIARYRVQHAYRTLPVVEGVHVIGWDSAARSDDPGVFAALAGDDICFVQFSSGSVGDPKPVPISHANLIANLHAILATDGRSPESTGYNFLPLSHDMGLVGGLLSNLVTQNGLHLFPPRSFFHRPLGFLSTALARDVVVAMPDFALRYLARHLQAHEARRDPSALAGLRNVYCGAEPIRYETVRALVEHGTRWGLDPSALIFCYGMAEATLIVTSRRFASLATSFVEVAGGRKVAAVGTPVPATELRVARPSAAGLEPAAPGAEAGLFVRGPAVFRGYLDGEPLASGWHDTEDLGFERAGELFVSGRTKDVIIIHGENIFPNDIEDCVAQLDGVRECVVLADGDRFHVVVSFAPGVTIGRDVIAAEIGCRFGSTPAAVLPAGTGSILRTASGKPMRQTMLAQLRAQGALT